MRVTLQISVDVDTATLIKKKGMGQYVDKLVSQDE